MKERTSSEKNRNEKSRDSLTLGRGTKFVWSHGGLEALFQVREELGGQEETAKVGGRRTKRSKVIVVVEVEDKNYLLSYDLSSYHSHQFLSPFRLHRMDVRPTVNDSSDCD